MKSTFDSGVDTDDCDSGKQSHGGAAEHRGRDGLDDLGGLGQKTEQDHDVARGGDHPATLDTGEADQSHVLGERGIWEGVEHAADGGGQAVRTNGGRDVFLRDAFADYLAGSENRTRGFDRDDRYDHDHHDDGDEVETWCAEGEGWREPDTVCLANRSKIGVAEDPRDTGAHDQAEEHSDGSQKPRRNRCISTMRKMVPTEYINQRPFPASGVCVAGSVVASPIPTGNSATPMIVMIDPVTTGGKNRISLAKNGAMKKVKIPALMTAP